MSFKNVFENTYRTLFWCYLNLVFVVVFCVFFFKQKREIDPFDYFFLKLVLRTDYENTKNIIFVFSENCYCHLNLVFCVLCVF